MLLCALCLHDFRIRLAHLIVSNQSTHGLITFFSISNLLKRVYFVLNLICYKYFFSFYFHSVAFLLQPLYDSARLKKNLIEILVCCVTFLSTYFVDNIVPADIAN